MHSVIGLLGDLQTCLLDFSPKGLCPVEHRADDSNTRKHSAKDTLRAGLPEGSLVINGITRSTDGFSAK